MVHHHFLQPLEREVMDDEEPDSPHWRKCTMAGGLAYVYLVARCYELPMNSSDMMSEEPSPRVHPSSLPLLQFHRSKNMFCWIQD